MNSTPLGLGRNDLLGTLHLVATPIGNLEDVSLRALRVLGEADLVLAEDTRRTRILLDSHHVSARPLSLHAHNEAQRINRAMRVLDAGGSVALVSDAGTPLISDPGGRLTSAVSEAGHTVTVVPGPSAVLAALIVSGLSATPFFFQGFLPRKVGDCNARLRELADRQETLVVFESPRRVVGTLKRMLDTWGNRRACLVREVTKLHEEVFRAPLSELVEHCARGLRGEVTLVVEGSSAGSEPMSWEAVEEEIRVALDRDDLPPGELSARLARLSGLPRREIYARIVELRKISNGRPVSS